MIVTVIILSNGEKVRLAPELISDMKALHDVDAPVEIAKLIFDPSNDLFDELVEKLRKTVG